MDIKAQTNQFGGVVFSITVEFVGLDIDSIVNSFLYWTKKQSEDSCIPKPYLPWTNWSRAEAIKGLEFYLMLEGQDADNDEAYPLQRRLYGAMAQRFAEELFPDLVFDRKEHDRRFKAFCREFKYDEDTEPLF